MALNPKADPWSPVIRKLPHIVYHPEPLFIHPPLTHFYYPMQLYNTNFHAQFQFPKPVHYSAPYIGFEKMSIPQQVHSNWDHKKLIKPPRFRTFTTSSEVTQVWKKKAVKQDFVASAGVEHLVDLGNDGQKTSVMIRNIPNKFRREELLKFLDFHCVQNHMEYDFVYLPMDFLRHNNYGYAFVNFTTSSAAAKIMSILDGHIWSDTQSPLHLKTSKKVCEMNWARIQGKKELVHHFQQSKFSCVENEYLPVVFSPPRNGTTSLSTPLTIGQLGGNPQQKRRSLTQKKGSTCLPM